MIMLMAFLVGSPPSCCTSIIESKAKNCSLVSSDKDSLPEAKDSCFYKKEQQQQAASFSSFSRESRKIKKPIFCKVRNFS